MQVLLQYRDKGVKFEVVEASTTTPHSINKYTRVINIDVLLFTGLYEK